MEKERRHAFVRVQIEYGFACFQVRLGLVVTTVWIGSEYGFVTLLDKSASESHTQNSTRTAPYENCKRDWPRDPCKTSAGSQHFTCGSNLHALNRSALCFRLSFDFFFELKGVGPGNPFSDFFQSFPGRGLFDPCRWATISQYFLRKQ